MSDLNTFNAALIECIKSIGGSKPVGVIVFPEKPVDLAQRLLLNCLNEERPEKLSPDQALLIMRKAKEVGCHVGMEFLSLELSYAPPQPIEPQDEVAELQKQFIEASKAMTRMAERIEQINGAVKK